MDGMAEGRDGASRAGTNAVAMMDRDTVLLLVLAPILILVVVPVVAAILWLLFWRWAAECLLD